MKNILVMEDIGLVPMKPSNPDNAIEVRNASFAWVVSAHSPVLEGKKTNRTGKFFLRNRGEGLLDSNLNFVMMHLSGNCGHRLNRETT